MDFRIQPSRVTGGTVRVPGDKSISHRALLLGAIADGETRIRGFLAGADCLATLGALAAMGVATARPAPDCVTVAGAGLHGLRAPAAPLDLGNSGTAMRLLAGLMAAQSFDSRLTGDASLSARPMARVIAPLERMGARIDSRGGRPPLDIHGGRPLHGIDCRLPVASAQVKSAVLLAGLYADGATTVREPAVTRDHTERMLQAMGADLGRSRGVVRLAPGAALRGRGIEVPADLSSAIFPLLAVLLSPGARALLPGVGVNPTRAGGLDILRAMGADIRLRRRRSLGDEPVADIEVRASRLRGVRVDPARVSLAIDEFPALFAAAACARGTTEFSGLGELRVKESDRIRAMTDGLRALGVAVEETADGARIEGGRPEGGEVDSRDDHRVAMSFAVAATVARGPVRVHGVDNVATSFPGFVDCLRALGAAIETGAGAPA